MIVFASCIATCFCCCCCCLCCCKYKYTDPEEDEEFKSFEQTALVEYAPRAEDFMVEDNDTTEDFPSTSNVKVTSNPFFAAGAPQQDTTFV